MKSVFKFMVLLVWPAFSFGQQYRYYKFPDEKAYDSLMRVLPAMSDQRQKMAAYHQFAFYLSGENRDSSLHYLNLELLVARKYGLKLWEADALDGSGYIMWRLGDYPGALQRFLTGIKLAGESDNDKDFWGVEQFDQAKSPRTARLIVLAQLEFDLSTLYHEAGYIDNEFQELIKGEKIATENQDKSALAQINAQLGSYYLAQHQTDLALTHLQRSVLFSKQSGFGLFEGDALNDIGNIYLLKADYRQASTYFARAVVASKAFNSDASLTHTYMSIADINLKQQKVDSALYYARKALALTHSTHDLSDAALVDGALASVFKMSGHLDSAFQYQGMAMVAKDSLNGAEKVRKFQNVGFREQLRVQQLEEEKIAAGNKVRLYVLLAGLTVLLLIAFILWRNNRQKQKANTILAQTLAELETTQNQLIQSAKMASLGELTAGIAHEIQNPLNFVNNFSEVTIELAEELAAEIEHGDQDEAKALVSDIRLNLEKITHHGKRAENIVKGMLEHSRTSSGQKEHTDLNQLINEYLQLAYHGIRAKDNSFTAELVTRLDPQLPPVLLIPQDIGRVLLNLFNNAFYAVRGKPQPKVTIVTATKDKQVIIRVIDNGSGIPEAILDKVMQPFFTTKPTGEGTGLGLSLSYDIVVKGHQGRLVIQRSSDQGTELLISLPI